MKKIKVLVNSYLATRLKFLRNETVIEIEQKLFQEILRVAIKEGLKTCCKNQISDDVCTKIANSFVDNYGQNICDVIHSCRIEVNEYLSTLLSKEL